MSPFFFVNLPSVLFGAYCKGHGSKMWTLVVRNLQENWSECPLVLMHGDLKYLHISSDITIALISASPKKFRIKFYAPAKI